VKLRIRGNALRLRLQRSEVSQLASDGKVVETTAFGSAGDFHYSLEAREEISSIQARLEPSSIRILLPRAVALEWAQSDVVSLAEEQTTESGPLRILVEKDFFCLKPRDAKFWEDDSDAFPNPNPTCGGPA